MPLFWERGLSTVWSNSTLLTAPDVLRYRYPSVVRGWEQGLLAFVRSRLFPLQRSIYDRRELHLLRDIVSFQGPSSQSCCSHEEKREEAERGVIKKVIVIHGSRDSVIPVGNSKMIGKKIGNGNDVEVRIVEGAGHNMFEEDAEGFVDLLTDCLENEY